MKKLLVLIFAVAMAFSLTACGEKGIELTEDNYETYLDVSCSQNLSGAVDFGAIMTGQYIGSSVYTKIDLGLSISGKSDNYDYNDVAVTVRIKGNYYPMSREMMKANYKGEMKVEEADVTLTAKTDIIGKGNDSRTIRMPSDYYLLSSGVNLNFEVVEVTGTMTPA